MKYHNMYSLLALPIKAAAFSSITTDPYANPISRLETADVAPTDTSAGMTECVPWRVALNIGREPLSRMPFDWARSGCRMPLIIPCDFGRTENNSNPLLPQSKTVSFTGPEGAVVKPIQGGEWKLTKDFKELTFSFLMPETLIRRDVTIDAGTTLELSGRVYSQAELDELNDEYYQAREAVWQVGGELSEISDREGAAKKWNKENARWEKRYPQENPMLFAQKQITYWAAKARQNQRQSQRPDLNMLSDRGNLPGVEGGLYISKAGILRAGTNGPVMGTWSAQPITDRPASYRN